MEETSLSDFVGDGESESVNEETDASATPAVAASDDPESAVADGPTGDPREPSAIEDEPDRPTITAAWLPEGGTCERCGEAAGWRWTDADALVCRRCKDW